MNTLMSHDIHPSITHLLNWMKTRFQISISIGSSALTSSGTTLPPILSKWISEQGPHGPVSPISQKLSFIPNGSTRSGGNLEYCTRGQVGYEIGLEYCTIGQVRYVYNRPKYCARGQVCRLCSRPRILHNRAGEIYTIGWNIAQEDRCVMQQNMPQMQWQSQTFSHSDTENKLEDESISGSEDKLRWHNTHNSLK